MAYIGKKVEETELANRTVDTMTGDGSDTTMSLSATPISVNNVLVFFNGVMQRPTTDFTLSGSTITFGTAPFTGAVVVAITGEGGHIGRPSSPLTTEKFMDSAITNAKIATGIASSKLTGALPALDGSALTGGATGYTENASDPAVTTNPSGGVGTFWVNTTSGETFCLTDATTNANVWVNIGGGEGDVGKAFGGNGPGTISGFNLGGQNSTNFNVIDRFSLTSDGGATDVANLSASIRAGAGSSSATHGYNSGGHNNSANVATIDKFTFATSSDAAAIGNLTSVNYRPSASSSVSDGYVTGNAASANNVIQRFSFSTDGNATNVGTLLASIGYVSGQSSNTHGYTSAGGTPALSNVIQKWSYSSSTTAVDHGDLTHTMSAPSGHSSATDGFTTAGDHASGQYNIINKFSFGSANNATDHGDLTIANSAPGGVSSTTHGYATGGYPTSNTRIDKFAYTTNVTASNIGTLSNVLRFGSGVQY